MTDRLYYNDAYLTKFTAVVQRVIPLENHKQQVYLDRSAFYPTSGGQPCDLGTLNSSPVTDVFVDDSGDVAHIIDGVLQPGHQVEGNINWDRRFDHMQQHAGEHMLAGRVFMRLHGHTNGLHLGHENSSIDVDFPDGAMHLPDNILYALEDEVNERIQSDLTIRCWFPDADELSELPLRKPPAVNEHIRVVQIGSDEFCACGGTHPSSTGQIGLFKLTDVRPSRGKLRFTFVCGKRANLIFRKHMETVKQLSTLLSADLENLPAAANDIISKYKNTLFILQRERTDNARDQLIQFAKRAPVVNGIKLVRFVFDGLDGESIKNAASAASSIQNCVVLLASHTSGGISLLFTRHSEVDLDMCALLRAACAAYGGKGGGTSDFARGSTMDIRVLDEAERLIREDFL